MEFDDYTSSSEQLEKEYEATIEQNEKTIKDLRSMHHREQKEKDSLKVKYCVNCVRCNTNCLFFLS